MRMDHYSTLGVPRDADHDTIKAAFRKLAMKHHPDKGGDPNEFQKINEAYETLSDPTKRAQYDNPQQGNPFGGFNFNMHGFDLNDLFGSVFGQRGFHHQQHNAKPTYRTRVTVSLVDVYNGAEQVLQLGTPTGTKVINIKIPAGIYNGSSIRYDNILDGGASLIIEFVILPDLRFEREGDDLYSNLPISVLDLITGTKVKFTTIAGNTLDVTIDPCTQPHQQIKIAGHGMPRQDGTRGNQILLLKPFIPANVHTDIIDAIKRNHSN